MDGSRTGLAPLHLKTHPAFCELIFKTTVPLLTVAALILGWRWKRTIHVFGISPGAPVYLSMSDPRKLPPPVVQQIDLKLKSVDRIHPECDNFFNCGGCLLQHWNKDKYIDWKLKLLELKFQRIILIQ